MLQQGCQQLQQLCWGGIPYLAMAALVAVGLACVYMSQDAATELRVIQDDHMAKQQSKAMQHIHDVPVPTIVKEAATDVEYPQNQRSGRNANTTWVQTTEGIDTSPTKNFSRASS